MRVLIIAVVLLFLNSCSECSRNNFDKLIPPVRVVEKSRNVMVLKDSKDNIMRLIHPYNSWEDSIYRNHKVGDLVGGVNVFDEKESKDWLN